MATLHTPTSLRNSSTDELPRLAPIEEIDSPIEVARLGRKRILAEERRERHPSQSSIVVLDSNVPRLVIRLPIRLLLLIVFVAGCGVGVSVILLAR